MRLLLAALACSSVLVAALVAVGGPKSDRALVRESLADLRRRSALESTARFDGPVEPTDPLRRRLGVTLATLLAGVGRRLSPPARIAALDVKLNALGNPDGWNCDRILAAKAAGLAVGMVGGLGMGAAAGGPVLAVAACLAGAAAGFLLPNAILYQLIYTRRERLRGSLADALDLMVVCMEGGQSFASAVVEVGRVERGPLGSEFRRVIEDLNLGTPETALTALADRAASDDVQRFASSMAQSMRLGAPAGEALRVQADEMRLKRRQAAEERAQKVPVKMVFPLVTLILPALFVVIMGPAVINIVTMMGR